MSTAVFPVLRFFVHIDVSVQPVNVDIFQLFGHVDVTVEITLVRRWDRLVSLMVVAFLYDAGTAHLTLLHLLYEFRLYG